MLQVTYMGEDFQFTRCKCEVKESGRRYIWHILAQNKNAVAKISASCTKEEMLSLQYEDPEGKKPKLPLRAGAGGLGTLQLYHRVAGGRQLLDTLKLEDALCIYQHEQESPKSCD